jgi:S1-C subfamily serine protease
MYTYCVNSVDILILILVFAVAVRGVASGFLRQAGSMGGFLVGLMLGGIIAPWLGDAVAPGTGRALVVLIVFFGIALTLAGIGETLGYYLSNLAEKYRLRSFDAIAGAAFGVGVTLLVVWLLASTFARTSAFAAEIQNSRILQSLDHTLPPAPDVVVKLERALGADGFPRVFVGLEPSPAPPVTGPNADAVNAAATAGRDATVRVEGLGCGGLLEGSGFVAGQGLVATNAHVVAGISRPLVVDANGTHPAIVVAFDPDLDFAVLRTSGLAASPLPIDSGNEPRGTVGAVLGYPGGGRFTVSPAAILDRTSAAGRNIYDQGLIRRDIYSLQTVVRPGNSGGPVVSPDGTVIGVVFAMSTTNPNLGYALTSAEVIPALNRAASQRDPVGSGACASE